MTPAAAPRVSIVIPCYNQARYLGEALESLAAQDHPTLEIVVVDDGSTDGPERIARRYPGVRVIHQKNAGLSSARNAGLRATQGEFVVFLDADDRLRPGAIRIGVERLIANRAAAFTAGRCAMIDDAGRRLPIEQRPLPRTDHYDALLRECFIWMPAAVMYRRARVEQLGGCTPGLDASADYDLYLRMAREFPVDTHDAIVADYRRHETCITARPGVMLRSTLSALAAQRPFVARDRRLAEAYGEGRRFWQRFYGSLLTDQIRADMRVPSRWGRALAGAVTLLRYAPRTFAHEMWRKARLMLMPWRREAGGSVAMPRFQ